MAWGWSPLEKSSFPIARRVLALWLLTMLHPVCGEKNTAMEGPPSPPRDLALSVIGVGVRAHHLRWLASLNTGRLPVNYSVTICLNDSMTQNISLCKKSQGHNCNPGNIRSNNRKFSCILVDVDFFDSYTSIAYDYMLYVTAKNKVGNATSAIFSPHIPQSLVTPLPPVSVTAQARSSSEIFISWQARGDWDLIDVEYKIVFHAESGINKTKTVHSKQNYTRLTKVDDGLQDFTIYYLYVMVRLISDNRERSHYSDLYGPVKVRTMAGVPRPAPEVKRHHSMIFPENAALRNITVEWKHASERSWHGTPHSYKIECIQDRSLPLDVCNNDVKSTFNQTVLKGLNSSDNYNVYVKFCNKEGHCSAPGNSYTIKAEDAGVTPNPNGGDSVVQKIILIAAAVVIGIILVVCFFWCSRKWYVSTRQDAPLNNITLDDPELDDYTIVNPLTKHEYDRADLSASNA